MMRIMILLLFWIFVSEAFPQTEIFKDLHVHKSIKVLGTENGSKVCNEMSDAQMIAIVSPVNGECVYNTDKKSPFFYSTIDTKWKPAGGGASIAPGATGEVIQDIEKMIVPAYQVTKTDSTTALIETGNSNLLVNPGFEHSTPWTAWTLTTTGTPLVTNNFTDDPLLVYPDGGKKSLILACAGGASGGTCSYIQEVTTIETSGAVRGCLSISQGATVSLFSLVNGGRQTELSVTDGDLVDDGKWNCYEIPMVMGATSSGIEILVTVAASETPVIYADKMEIGAGKLIGESSNISEWKDYTPTFTGLTVTIERCKYRQNGSSYDIDCKFNSTASTATEARMTLPNGSAASTGWTGTKPVGTMLRNAATAGYVRLWSALAEPGFDYLTFGGIADGGTLNPYIKQPGSTLWHPFTFTVVASVPIQGLTASTTTYSQQVQSDVDIENSASVQVAAGGVVEKDDLDIINGNCALSGTSNENKTCSFNTGIYTEAPIITATGCGVIARNVSVSGTTSTSAVFTTRVENNTSDDAPFCFTVTKTGADRKTSKSFKGTFKDHVKSIGSNTGADIQSVFFGGNSDCTGSCTTGTCIICSKVGDKITSVTFSITGRYQLNGIDGEKYNCTGTNYAPGGTAYGVFVHNKVSSTTDYAMVDSGVSNSTALRNSAYNSIVCMGDNE